MSCDGHVFLYRYDSFMRIWKKFIDSIREKENLMDNQYRDLLNEPNSYTIDFLGEKLVVEYIEHCESYHNWIMYALEIIALIDDKKVENEYYLDFILLRTKELKKGEDYVMKTVWR